MHTFRIHYLESKYELLKLLRQPAYALPTVFFPVLFYLFFAVGFGDRGAKGVQMATYLVATYGAFGVMGAALFGFGVSVAIERGQGWLEVKRTTPMPISAYFVAKTAMAMIFGTIVVTLLLATGILFGNVVLTVGQIALLYAILVPGSIVFCAMGLAIGCLVSANSAAPIVNLVFLPLAFLSGLWIPIRMLPKGIQDLAAWLPPYHFSQLALKVVGASRNEPVLGHVAALVAATALFTVLAWVGFRRGDPA